jgi:predicted RNA-binding Zn-ribbon protein involved in translation (DUF1610 family)
MVEPYEIIDHPPHYNQHPSGVECINIIKYMMFLPAIVIKHVWRAGLKPGMTVLDDLRKARRYLDYWIEMEETKIMVSGEWECNKCGEVVKTRTHCPCCNEYACPECGSKDWTKPEA